MGLEKPDPRMRDAELIIRYFAFRNFLSEYTGNLKPMLDATAEHFNSVWQSDQSQIQSQRKDFEDAIEMSIQLFGAEAAFRKWNGHRYERALNRAVFDVMMYYLADGSTRNSINAIQPNIETAFKDLCRVDVFRASIEGTTKSIDAIYTRLRLWGVQLQSLGVSVRLPELVNNKIIRR